MSETETVDCTHYRSAWDTDWQPFIDRWAGKRLFLRISLGLLMSSWKPKHCVVDLVGSIKKSANETQVIRVRYKAKIISQQASEDFLTVKHLWQENRSHCWLEHLGIVFYDLFIFL